MPARAGFAIRDILQTAATISTFNDLSDSLFFIKVAIGRIVQGIGG